VSSDTRDLVRLLARLYYVDGLDQNEVAQISGISRSQVSRLLARARETGIVRISVEEYVARNRDLELSLTQALHLKHAIVVRALHPAVAESVRHAVGYFAAPCISEWIRPGMILGVAGGRTIAEVVGRMQPVNGAEGCSVVQLMGNIGPSVSHTDAIEISRTLASRLRGIYYTVNAPAFADNTASQRIFLAHPDVRSVWRLFGAMQMAMVGLGTLRDSLFIARGTLRSNDIADLKAQGAVGEICGRFYDRAGRECRTEFSDRVISIGFEELSHCAEVIGVTHGADRAEAILAAVTGGLMTSLIIDEEGARAILAIAGLASH
jgi:deoxyribonucleoside regulator